MEGDGDSAGVVGVVIGGVGGRGRINKRNLKTRPYYAYTTADFPKGKRRRVARDI